MDEHEKEMYKRILNQFKGRWQPPFKIDLELHRRCNLKCLSCSRRSDPNYENINEYSKKAEMPKEKWLGIVEEARDLDVREWHIAGGGEPMLLPEVTMSMMKLIKEYGMLGILTTNGTLWESKSIEETIKMEWDRIHFSVDGPNAEINDYLRNVPGTFEKIVKNIKVFNKLKKKYKTDKPMLNMNTVLSIKNYRNLPKMIEFAHNMSIEYVFVEPLIVYSKYGEMLKLKEQHIKEFSTHLENAKKLAEKFGILNNFSGLDQNLDAQLIRKSSKMHEIVKDDLEKVDRTSMKGSAKSFLSVPCYKPWFHMTIKSDGRTTSCDVPITGGDNIKNKSLSDIWNGAYFENLRNQLKSKQIPEFCASCNPSHTTQRRRFRLEALKLLEPKFNFKN